MLDGPVVIAFLGEAGTPGAGQYAIVDAPIIVVWAGTVVAVACANHVT